jgi:hypothetical protein
VCVCAWWLTRYPRLVARLGPRVDPSDSIHMVRGEVVHASSLVAAFVSDRIGNRRLLLLGLLGAEKGDAGVRLWRPCRRVDRIDSTRGQACQRLLHLDRMEQYRLVLNFSAILKRQI